MMKLVTALILAVIVGQPVLVFANDFKPGDRVEGAQPFFMCGAREHRPPSGRWNGRGARRPRSRSVCKGAKRRGPAAALSWFRPGEKRSASDLMAIHFACGPGARRFSSAVSMTDFVASLFSTTISRVPGE